MNCRSIIKTSVITTLLSCAASSHSADIEEIQKELERLREELESLKVEQQMDRAMIEASDRVLSDHPADGPNAVTEGLVIARDTAFELIIGGYARLDFLYTPQGIGDEESWATATIPVRSSTDGEWYLNTTPGFVETENQFRFNVKQTRLSLESKTETGAGLLKVYIETDFWGTGQLRLRHAYAEFKDWRFGESRGNWLVGQTWSSFIVVNSWVDVLDFQGPNSNSDLRLPMVRWRQFVTDSFIYTLSLEQNPYDVTSTDVYVEGAQARPGKFTGTYPMVVAAFVFGDDRFNVQVSGAYAHIQADVEIEIPPFPPARRNEKINGVAFNVGGSLGVTDVDTLKYYFVYSDGLGRVMADLNSGFAAGVFGFNNDLKLTQLNSYGTQLGYEHQWTPRTKSSVVWGYVNVNNAPRQPEMAFKESQYGALNYIWTPIDQMLLGGELQYGYRENHNGDNNDAWRIQMATQYNF